MSKTGKAKQIGELIYELYPNLKERYEDTKKRTKNDKVLSSPKK